MYTVTRTRFRRQPSLFLSCLPERATSSAAPEYSKDASASRERRRRLELLSVCQQQLMPLHGPQQTLRSRPRSAAECFGWTGSSRTESTVTVAVNCRHRPTTKPQSCSVLMQWPPLRRIMTQSPVTATNVLLSFRHSIVDQLFVRMAEVSAAESTTDRRSPSATPESQPRWGRPWLPLPYDAAWSDDWATVQLVFYPSVSWATHFVVFQEMRLVCG